MSCRRRPQRVYSGFELVKVAHFDADTGLRGNERCAGLVARLDELADGGVALAVKFVDVRAHRCPRLLELVHRRWIAHTASLGPVLASRKRSCVAWNAARRRTRTPGPA